MQNCSATDVRNSARPEAQLNRLLRLMDWRFLLPSPQLGKTACFTRGPLAEAVAFMSLDATASSLSDSSTCDVAVASNPKPAEFTAAAAAVRPGGWLYIEWHSLFGIGPIRVRLKAAGFRFVISFRRWPAGDTPQLWFPREAHRFVTGLMRPSSSGHPLRRFVRKLRWTRTRIELAASLGNSICVLARKQDPAEESAPSLLGTGIVESIRAGWNLWQLGPAPDSLLPVLITGGSRSTNKVVALIGDRGGTAPRVAVKLPRVPETNAALKKEAGTLEAVHHLRKGGIRGVPRVLFTQSSADSFILGETALSGTPLFAVLDRSNYRELALKGTDWLIELAADATPRLREALPGLFQPVLDDFSRLFSGSYAPDLLQRTRATLATLPALQRVCEHRDFSPWNVLLTSSGDLAILDWESAELDGLPFLDLTYYLAHLSFFFDRATESGRYAECYMAMLDPETVTGRVHSECIARYARALGLDPDIARPLRALAWMLHARSEHARLASGPSAAPSMQTLRSSVFLTLWKQELLRTC
jgi:hypothetical protein